MMHQTLKNYKQTIDLYEDKIIQLDREHTKLERKLNKLERYNQQLETRYKLYEDSIDQDSDLEHDEEVKLIPVTSIQKRIDEIEGRIRSVTLDFESQLEPISKLIEAGKHKRVSESVHHTHSLALRMHNLKDILDVRLGKKYYVDGEGLATKSFKKAEFHTD